MKEFNLIRQWAESRGIYEKGDLKTQYIKLQEESGELAKAILENDLDEIIDAIGDCVVVLTSIAELTNKHFNLKDYSEDVIGDGGLKMYFNEKILIEDCIKSAYEVISKRKGKMDNGTFKKNK